MHSSLLKWSCKLERTIIATQNCQFVTQVYDLIHWKGGNSEGVLISELTMLKYVSSREAFKEGIAWCVSTTMNCEPVGQPISRKWLLSSADTIEVVNREPASDCGKNWMLEFRNSVGKIQKETTKVTESKQGCHKLMPKSHLKPCIHKKKCPTWNTMILHIAIIGNSNIKPKRNTSIIGWHHHNI